MAGDAGQATAIQSRRRTLRGNSARDAERRRLGHTSFERLGLYRETAAAILGDRVDVSTARSERIHRTLVLRADRARDTLGDRPLGAPAVEPRRGLARRGGIVRHVDVRGPGPALDVGHEPDVLHDVESGGLFIGATGVAAAPVDAVGVGGSRRRRAHQRPRRSCPAGCGIDAVQRVFARLRAVAPAARTVGSAAISSRSPYPGTGLPRGGCRISWSFSSCTSIWRDI